MFMLNVERLKKRIAEDVGQSGLRPTMLIIQSPFLWNGFVDLVISYYTTR